MTKLNVTLDLIESELSYLEDELACLEDLHNQRGFLFTFRKDEPLITDEDGLSKSVARCKQIVESASKND